MGRVTKEIGQIVHGGKDQGRDSVGIDEIQVLSDFGAEVFFQGDGMGVWEVVLW